MADAVASVPAKVVLKAVLKAVVAIVVASVAVALVAAASEAEVAVANRIVQKKKPFIDVYLMKGFICLFNDRVVGKDGLEFEVVLGNVSDIIAASALLGINLTYLDVFLLGFLTRQPKRDNAGTLGHIELVGKIIA